MGIIKHKGLKKPFMFCIYKLKSTKKRGINIIYEKIIYSFIFIKFICFVM